MNWPFKLFDNFVIKGRSNTKEVKQKVKKNTGKVQQAARDIHNHPRTVKEELPVLFIDSLGWSRNQEGVSLTPHFMNASNKVLFIESFNILGNLIDFDITISANQSTITHLPSRSLPTANDANEILMFYRDTADNHYCARHTVKLDVRDDGSFNFGAIRFEAPVRRERRRKGNT